MQTHLRTVMNFAQRLALTAVLAVTTLTSGLLATAPAPAVVAAVALTATATSADAGLSFVTSLRTSRCQAIVTAAGASATAELRTGSKPASTAGAGTLPTATGTLLATVTFGSTIGTCGTGSLDFDEAGITQSNGSHVSGTPGWIRLKTSGGTAIVDIDVCGSAPCWTFTGTVTSGQNVSGSSLVFNEGNV